MRKQRQSRMYQEFHFLCHEHLINISTKTFPSMIKRWLEEVRNVYTTFQRHMKAAGQKPTLHVLPNSPLCSGSFRSHIPYIYIYIYIYIYTHTHTHTHTHTVAVFVILLLQNVHEKLLPCQRTTFIQTCIFLILNEIVQY